MADFAGPFSFPFLGYYGQGKLINKLLHKEFETLGTKYGNLIFFKLFMDQPVLVVRGYDLVKEATSSRAFSGVGQPLMFREAALHRRLGLIFSDGDNWGQMRRFTVRALQEQGFGRSRRSDNINSELGEVLARLSAAAGGGGGVRVRYLFTAPAANSLLQLVLGEKMPADGRLQRALYLVDRNTAAFSPSYLHLELFPWLRLVAPRASGFLELRQSILELVHLFDPQIERHKAALDDAKHHGPPSDLVEAFLRRQRDSVPPHAFSNDNLRVLVRDLFVAGMDTASTVMEWVVMMLVQHPDAQERAAAEVEDVIGRDRAPSIDDMQTLPYVDAFIEETMRMNPVLPVIQHSTTFGSAWLGGHHVPANCRVIFDFRSVMHERSFWGDPDQFRPERFLGPDGPRLRGRMAAFGMGLRRCIGETHARQVLFLFTAGILQRFRLECVDVGRWETNGDQLSLVLKPPDIAVTVERRS
ncbi:farnesoate epoxidase-like [Amphibalanus amphitrite]|uniref:farnesoate epoxidase-like n=1 Tax=Amphibalanus amphitrite TaxID=1232801 RepID=UPI001C91F31B|nr:farnesoate epoxidase-like [Amphibalanus amphitrite]